VNVGAGQAIQTLVRLARGVGAFIKETHPCVSKTLNVKNDNKNNVFNTSI